MRVVARDHAAEGAIGNVDDGVHQRKERVGDGREDHLPGEPQVGRAVREHAAQPEWNGPEKNVGTELSPAGTGAICKQAHDGIANRIQTARDQEHGADERRREPEDVGIEERHVEHDVVEDDVAGCVAEPVTDLFPCGERGVVHVR